MKNQAIKAVFLDVDGTLFSHRTNSVPDSASAAVKKAKEKGILVFAATGRHILELKDLGFEMDLDGWITLNGALCFNRRETYYEAPLTKDDIEAVLSGLKEHPFPCQFMEKDLMYINADSPEVRKSLEMIHTPMPPILDPERARREKTYMLIPWVQEEVWHKIFEKTQNLKYTRWTPLAADVLSKDSGKYRGVRETCRCYSIDPNQTAAFGDGPNDIELFDACGFSVAMGNSTETLKKAADAVCGDIDSDGLAKAFEQYILSQKE